MSRCFFISLFFAWCSCNASAGDKAPSLSESIVAPLVEDDLRQAKSDIRELEKNIKILDGVLLKVQSVEVAKKEPAMDSSAKWDVARKILLEAKNTNSAIGVKRYRAIITNFQESLSNSLVSPQKMVKLFGISMLLDGATEENKFLRSAGEAYRAEMDKYYSGLKERRDPLMIVAGSSFELGLGSLDELGLGVYDEEDFPEERAKEFLFGLEPLLAKDFSKVYFALQSDIFDAAISAKKAAEEALKQQLKIEKENLAAKREQLKSSIAEFQELQKQDQSRRENTDQLLVYAVYGMIFALMVLFFLIKFLKDDVAKSLIVNRSLVEVVSMAFMLITIIILGTGEKLNKEILGTLLGTIGGYVFARGTEEKKGPN